MNLVLTVLQVIAPVFGLGALGVAWVRVMRWEYPLEFVTRLAMSVATPCLIFIALMEAQMAPQALATLSLASALAYAAVIAATWAVARALSLDRRTYLAPLAFGNTGNIGLPLALFAFGPEGLSYAVVVFAVMALMTFSFGVGIVAGRMSFGFLIREPMVLAAALGVLFLAQGWTTPQWLTETLRLVGQMAIPLMLITLGVAVARLATAQLGRALGLSALKAVLSGTAAVLVGQALGLGPIAFAVLVVQLLTPVAVTSYMLAEKYAADAQAVAGLVVVSTLLSVALLPVVMGVLLAGMS